MDKLQDAGITTMQALAETSQTHIARLDDAIFARLREQARLQIASAKRLQPAYQIVTPVADDPRKGLAVLPPASRLDVYFDMEAIRSGRGLEYLFARSTSSRVKPDLLTGGRMMHGRKNAPLKVLSIGCLPVGRRIRRYTFITTPTMKLQPCVD